MLVASADYLRPGATACLQVKESLLTPGGQRAMSSDHRGVEGPRAQPLCCINEETEALRAQGNNPVLFFLTLSPAQPGSS